MSETKQVSTPIDYAKLMAEAAARAVEQEKPDNKFISFKSGMLALNGNAVPGNKMDVIIVGVAFENQYYPHKYDPNNVLSPDCYAVALTEDDLAPIDADCTNAVHSDCESCKLNEWESDPNGGKGKACKNTRRLAIIPAAEIDNLDGADVLYARLPVTSVANWAKYVTQIGNVVKRPAFGVITELSVIPDIKSQFKVCFQFKALLPDNVLEHVVPVHERIKKEILFGYPKNDQEQFETPKTPAKKK